MMLGRDVFFSLWRRGSLENFPFFLFNFQFFFSPAVSESFNLENSEIISYTILRKLEN